MESIRKEQEPDYENMEDGIDYLMDFYHAYDFIQQESIPDGTKFDAYKSNWWGTKKIIASLKIEFIKDFQQPTSDPAFDDQYLNIELEDKFGKKVFISNYGCIKNSIIELRKEVYEDGYMDHFADYSMLEQLTAMSNSYSKVEEYENLLKKLNVFEVPMKLSEDKSLINVVQCTGIVRYNATGIANAVLDINKLLEDKGSKERVIVARKISDSINIVFQNIDTKERNLVRDDLDKHHALSWYSGFYAGLLHRRELNKE